MPSLTAISKIDFPDKIYQKEVKKVARQLFETSFPQVEKMINALDNKEQKAINFCKPLDYYSTAHSFKNQNTEYIRIALKYSVKAIEDCISSSQINKDEITDIIFVSTTGLSTPGLDTLIINEMGLNQNVSHISIFGLGCAGGVSGFSKANILAIANPDAVVLLVAAELCSMTFLPNEYSKSNFTGSNLYADGVAACLIEGDNRPGKRWNMITFIGSQSTSYYEKPDVMGSEFLDKEFKAVFPSTSINSENIQNDVSLFLGKYQLELSDITNFIFYTSGEKELSAYEEVFSSKGDLLKHSREVMNNYGNMSSPTVLYVLERFIYEGFEKGYGLMLTTGSGSSSELVLLKMGMN